MKRIGFLSFGHWGNSFGSQVRTAADSLLQGVELAVAAEEVGVDGAFFRVHHFARQQAAPFTLLAAAAARTSSIELGTGVIDMRYENPLYMAEQAAQVDLLSGGRVQLGISRGSPETVVAGYRAFGNVPLIGEDDGDMARRHTAQFLDAITGTGLAPANPHQGGNGLVAIHPQSDTLHERIWWGAGKRATAKWAAEQGMNLMASTLLTEDTGVPFDALQSEQIQIFRDSWQQAGHGRTPRVSVLRSVIPLIDDRTRAYFGPRARAESQDQVGVIAGAVSRFGRGYIGEPDRITEELARDTAVQAADTLIVTVPNQLGVDFNVRLLESIVKDIAPGLGD
ncbi:LLM class flavin-dependent oxidoreductase [Rhodococcus opacus]|uniref:Alkane 1-monooxygenase n=1 Tax=Rhodococcus opacus TaxID=37919 RepID=A0A076EYD1_RHOOP|nr:LLM class flavin-dependent oxidoreductase [Rhodococcus opacus]AII10970.1 alkane 1-monooxygenase [Rhodococcus opacus]